MQGIPQSIRTPYLARLRLAKSNLNEYKKLSKDLHAQVSRADLLSHSGLSPSSDEPYGQSNDRTRLLAGTSILEDGSRRLLESQRIALETEEQGADILRGLRGQREQIQNARDTVCSPCLPVCFPSSSHPVTPAIPSRHFHRSCLGYAEQDDPQASSFLLRHRLTRYLNQNIVLLP